MEIIGADKAPIIFPILRVDTIFYFIYYTHRGKRYFAANDI